jgi:hypothetical protein
VGCCNIAITLIDSRLGVLSVIARLRQLSAPVVRYRLMEAKDFSIIELDELKWPTALNLPTKRFRLFVAADVTELKAYALADFASAALRSGMVYFCSWGRDCERFHDIVDEVIANDCTGERRFTGPTPKDTVMTTWHDNETLEEALDFFNMLALPTEGLMPNSRYRVAVCVGNPAWAVKAKQSLESAEFLA